MSIMEKKTHGRILVELSDIWIMEGRDDLFDDCLEEICSEYDFYDGKIDVKDLTLEWLQKALFKANPLSSADIKKMAKDYGEDV
jgi:hypothetical protein